MAYQRNVRATAPVSVTWEGIEGVNRVLSMLPAVANKVLGAFLYNRANAIINRSIEIVPFDLGHLSASAVVEPPVELADYVVSVRMGYGGPAINYAVVQHEDLNLQHDPGRQAKYLETPALEAAGTMLADAGRELAMALAVIERSGLTAVSNLPGLNGGLGTFTGGFAATAEGPGFTDPTGPGGKPLSGMA